jgi:chromosome segregation ATPase
MKLRLAEMGLSAQAELKRKANDSLRLEIQVQALQKENEKLVDEINRVRFAEKGSRQAEADMEQALSENRVLRGQIQDMKRTVEKAEQLEIENASLTKRVAFLMDQQGKAEQGLRMAARLTELEKENATLRQSGLETGNEIASLKARFEGASHEVLQLTHEIQERERRESHLTARYLFYKSKVEQLDTQTKVCDGTIDDLTRDLSRMKGRESRKEAALRRNRRCETHDDLQRTKLVRQLDSERDKVLELETLVRTGMESGGF